MRFYNGRMAAAYALKYAFKYNPEWPSYVSTHGVHFGGGDCTNFVSQALNAGGWTMVRGFHWDDGSWYSSKGDAGVHDHSRAWTVAENFGGFLKTAGRARRCNMHELALGDVVQLCDYGIIHHTMIVTGVLPNSLKRNIPLVTYHTVDKAEKPLTTISSQEMRCWKLLYWFPEPHPWPG
jgi:Putative amidase domain